MPKLLWCGDAACPSGFAKATHYVLDTLRHEYDVTVLGINYRGDPHDFPYKIFAALPGGDFLGIGRLIWMCDYVKPDVIVLQNDGWNIPEYVQRLKQFKEYASVPIVAAVAIDGKNFQRKWLDNVDHTIFWTNFALEEVRMCGFQGAASVIPLGVDFSVFAPMDRQAAREERGISVIGEDAFVVGNINRNQPRKRWDLTLKYFAEWVLAYNIPNARLFLHSAPTGDTGIHIRQLAAYYGILERLLLMEPPTWYGLDESKINLTYNCFDVNVTTTQGEGFGLTTLEAMACGIPCIVPEWAALGDWPGDSVVQIPCDNTAVGPPYVNVIGGVVNRHEFIDALNLLYHSPELRAEMGNKALAKAQEPQYSWRAIGQRYLDVLRSVMETHHAVQNVRGGEDDHQHQGHRQEVS